MIDLFKLEEEVRDLIMDFQANKEKIRSLIAQVVPDFNKEVGKTIIYADMFSGDPSARNHRLSLFVMMYERVRGVEKLRPDGIRPFYGGLCELQQYTQAATGYSF